MGKYFPPTSAEIHAFGWGFMDGVHIRGQKYEKRIKSGIRFSDDIKAEPHYYRLGYFLTNRGKWIFGVLSFTPCL
jgi:hypothetical protein